MTFSETALAVFDFIFWFANARLLRIVPRPISNSTIICLIVLHLVYCKIVLTVRFFLINSNPNSKPPTPATSVVQICKTCSEVSLYCRISFRAYCGKGKTLFFSCFIIIGLYYFIIGAYYFTLYIVAHVRAALPCCRRWCRRCS